ncbi:MAG: HpaII family restriction endonuclease [Methanimicrococcus sp.]|nr:HpaII family restriction endonuclease [Methanimicrococcus sp.]
MANKGEWSETYVILKMIADGILQNADKNLKKIEGDYYPISKIYKKEMENIEYILEDGIIDCIIKTTEESISIPRKEFDEKAKILLKKIKEGKKSFLIPELDSFFKEIYLNPHSKSKLKSDITLVVYDQKTHENPTLGFSVKSYLGSEPTLLNASLKTNFIFKIPNITQIDVENITNNTISFDKNKKETHKIKERIVLILEKYDLLFEKVDDLIFEGNMKMIDSQFPTIMAHLVLLYYSKKGTDLQELTSELDKKDILQLKTNHHNPFYEHMIKKLLIDVALGMVPGTVWTGEREAAGGYIVILEDGDLVSYHTYDEKEFKEYLFTQTKLETASSGETRNNFGRIYLDDDGEYKIKLNLQIRFKKI